ncbi:MAG: hypothetical protein L0Y54_13545 [Sporichthyaceae bacterium]|nr:hypothetical protein [Sporichthyaceae bacterium]
MSAALEAAFGRGDELVVGDGHACEGSDWGANRQIPAGELRRLLLRGASPPAGDVASLRLAGARITGVLDLRDAVVRYPIALRNCWFDSPLDLLGARVPSLFVDGCCIPWIDAGNLTSEIDIWLGQTHVPHGIDLTDAKLGGPLHIEGARLDTLPLDRWAHDGTATLPRLPRRPNCAMRAERLTIDGALLADDIQARGLIDLSGARIQGHVRLIGARLTATGRTAVYAPRLTVAGGIYTDAAALDGPARQGMRVTGRVYLPGLRVGGDLDLSGSQLRLTPTTASIPSAELPPARASAQPSGPTTDADVDPHAVLVLDTAEIGGNLEMDRGFRARGLVRMGNAKIGGNLKMSTAAMGHRPSAIAAVERAARLRRTVRGRPTYPEVVNTRYYAILGDGMEVRGEWDCDRLRTWGEVRLKNATIELNAYFRDARMWAPAANALNLEGTSIAGAVGAWNLRTWGSLRLAGLRVGANLWLDGAALTDPCDAYNIQPGSGTYERPDEPRAADPFDPVLNLIGSTIGGGLRCSTYDAGAARHRFVARGRVDLSDATVGATVSLRDAALRNPGLDALTASQAHLGGLDCEELAVAGSVRLVNARIDTSVNLVRARLAAPGPDVALPVSDTARRADQPVISVVSLDCSTATIQGHLLCAELVAVGAVRLRRAQVGRSVTMDGAWLLGNGLALDAAGLRTVDLRLAWALPPRWGGVDLSRAVAVALVENEHVWAAERVGLWGLTYEMLVVLDTTERLGVTSKAVVKRRLAYLQRATILPPESSQGPDLHQDDGQKRRPAEVVRQSQPYIEYAAFYRATGEERAARSVLYAMGKARLPGLPRLVRIPYFVYGRMVGYGYRLHWAMYWLITLWLLAVAGFTALQTDIARNPGPGFHATRASYCTAQPTAAGAATPDRAGPSSISDDPDSNASPYAPVPVETGYRGCYVPTLYALDLLLPVVDLGQQSAWRQRPTWLQWSTAILELCGWALATAAAASLANLLRR